jgi:hypothetical protein
MLRACVGGIVQQQRQKRDAHATWLLLLTPVDTCTRARAQQLPGIAHVLCSAALRRSNSLVLVHGRWLALIAADQLAAACSISHHRAARGHPPSVVVVARARQLRGEQCCVQMWMQ